MILRTLLCVKVVLGPARLWDQDWLYTVLELLHLPLLLYRFIGKFLVSPQCVDLMRSVIYTRWLLDFFRLLHWASKGKEIDTVVVDYVLQKLGFSHARVTIPKWMQRGFMDPLDKLLSFLIEKLILTLKTPEVDVTDGNQWEM